MRACDHAGARRRAAAPTLLPAGPAPPRDARTARNRRRETEGRREGALDPRDRRRRRKGERKIMARRRRRLIVCLGLVSALATTAFLTAAGAGARPQRAASPLAAYPRSQTLIT